MSAAAVGLSPPTASAAADGRRGFPGPAAWLPACIVVVVVAVSHGVNMLHYPYLQVDEGTYFSQAWAVFHLGRLSPYTYIYDHAPVGWIQIGLWQLVIGDHSFGYALASGRILMLLCQIGSALMVLAIGRRSSNKAWVGLLAAVIFSLSTYGINYHRRILLDNIATFWLLLSIYLVVGQVRVRRVWLSGIAMGIAVLSKEVVLAAVPAIAVLAAMQTPKSSRVFAVGGWLGLSCAVCSTYLLIALLKGEFFPAGTMLGGHHPHVSLLCSLEWQSSRGSDGGVLDPSSQFWRAAMAWSHAEPLLVIGGTAAAAVGMLCVRRKPVLSMLGWTVASLWLFLGRGGVVLDFYLVPVLPLLALTLTMVLDETAKHVRERIPHRLAPHAAAGLTAVAIVGCAILIAVGYQRSDEGLWTSDPVGAQVQAITWIRLHVAPSSRMLIDDYMWNDLHDSPGRAARFQNAEYYWTVGEDPHLRRQVFEDDWRKVNYVITTPQLIFDTRQQRFPVVADALAHSVPVATFDTGGWRVGVRRVDPAVRDQLQVVTSMGQSVPGCMSYG